MAHNLIHYFGAADYVVFSLLLILSAAIGVWYAVVDRRREDTENYLMGGKSMSVFPVAMSAWHGFLSALSLLGIPEEVYSHGTQFVMFAFSFFLVIPATAYFYLPVYYNLQLTTMYEYLGIRFHPYVRTMGAALYFLHMTLYAPILLYTPALALSEVTGISIRTAVLSTGLICTFYTSIGGLKAVVWTDCIQSLIMVGAVLTVVIKGSIDIGGFHYVWQKGVEGNRIEFFRFDVDPTIRHTIWSLIIGGYVTNMGNFAASQSMVQRYMTVPTLKDARRVVWFNLPAVVGVVFMSGFAGLVIYAHYYDCDPLGAKLINAPDQIFPRFVMETLGSFPGIPGIFVAGVYSGAISTVATSSNSFAAVVVQDFVKIYIKPDISEKNATRVSKLVTFTFGMVVVGLAFVVEKIGNILQAAVTIAGVIGGLMLGVITLGMFFPIANTLGAVSGLVGSFAVMMWLSIGAMITPPFNPKASISFSGCIDLYYNATGNNITDFKYLAQDDNHNDEIFYLYRLSYWWLSVIGFITSLIVGLMISYCTGGRKENPVDEKLITPFIISLCKKNYMPLSIQKQIKLEEKSLTLENGEFQYDCEKDMEVNKFVFKLQKSELLT